VAKYTPDRGFISGENISAANISAANISAANISLLF
jgi:hypothetical protein